MKIVHVIVIVFLAVLSPVRTARAQDIPDDQLKKIPAGMYRKDVVYKWAYEITSNPKGVEKEFYTQYGTTGAPGLMRQLAGWAERRGADPNASQAYEIARDIHFKLYPEVGEHLQRLFVKRVAMTLHRGSARLKADVAFFLLEKIQAAEKANNKVVALETTSKQLSELLWRPGSDQMLMWIATELGRSSELHWLFSTVLKWDPIEGEKVVGAALGKVAYSVGKKAKLGDDRAKSAAHLLGVIQAHVEVAVLVDYQEEKGEEASIEHGAGIVRWSLRAVGWLLPGPAAKAAESTLGHLAEGLSMLESYEKAKEKHKKNEIRKLLREKMLDASTTPFALEIGIADRALDEEVQRQVRIFRKETRDGRNYELTRAGKLDQVTG